MTINQFITKAIEGGWKESLGGYVPLVKDTGELTEDSVEAVVKFIEREDLFHEMVLQPSAWQAVGKTEGWKSSHNIAIQTEWSKKMHGLVDALIFGKTIEQFLETL